MYIQEGEEEEMKVEYGRIKGEEEGDTDKGGLVRSSQHDVAPYEKNGLLERGLCDRPCPN